MRKLRITLKFLLFIVALSFILYWVITKYEVHQNVSIYGMPIHHIQNQLKETNITLPWVSHSKLPRIISKEKYEEFMELLQDFLQICDKLNSTEGRSIILKRLKFNHF